MNVQEARVRYGGIAALSRCLGISRTTIYAWVETGIPAEFQALIELQTNGVLKADRRKIRKAP